MTVKASDLVQVWVPAWLVPEVYRFLADRAAAGLPEPAARQTRPVEIPRTESARELASPPVTREERRRAFWTRGRVQTAYRESPESMRAFMEILAENHGQSLYTDDLEGPMSVRLGEPFNWRSMAGMLGGFTNRLKTRLGTEIDTWPFDCQRDNRRGRYFYIMSEWCAAWIKEFAADEHSE